MAKLLTGTRIYGTGTVDTQLFVSGTNSATSTTTGALQVVGGVGVGGNLHVGGIIYGAILGTATTATNADNIKTVSQTTSASYYPTFVDANNSTAAYEALYTTSSFVINPQSGNVGIGESDPLRKFVVRSDSSGSITAIGIYNGSTATSNGSVISFRSDTTGTGAATFQEFAGFSTTYTDKNHATRSADFNIFTANSGTVATRVIVKSTGNVGIGTPTPLSKFVVNGGTVDSTTYTSSEARIADGTLHLMKTSAGGVFEALRAINNDTTVGTTVRLLAAATSDPFNNGNGGKVFIDAVRTTANMDLIFSLNDTGGAAAVERLRILGSGAIAFNGSTNYGITGQILQSNGNAAPTWISTGSLFAANATTATHLSGGVAGQIPYQTAPGVTAFLSTGTAGDVLVSNGSSAATYNNTLRLAGSTNATSTTSGALQVVGGVGVGGDLFIHGDIRTNDTLFNLINANAITVNFAGDATTLTMGASGSGTTNVRNNLTVSGNLTVQGTTTIVDSTVTNIADPIITLGGGTGNSAPTADDNKDRGVAFKWVNNGGTTSTGFFGYDDSTGHFTYVQTATITNEVVSGTKGAMDVNLAGGTAMSIVYQSSPNNTAFLAASTSGFLLQTNGTGSPPTWVSASGVSAGSATYADSIRTIAQTASASYYPTFVDSNNASNAYESVYTTSSFSINPGTGLVTISGASGDGVPILRVTGTSAPAGGFNWAGSFMNSSLTTSKNTVILIGQAESTKNSGYIGFNYAGTAGSNSSFMTIGLYANDNILNVTGAGNVGIGTTSPAVKLAVAGILGVSESGSTGARLQITSTSAGAEIFQNDNSPIIFKTQTAPQEKMRITDAGNVGIGTNAPLAKLHIEGNSLTLNTEGSAQAKSLYFRYSNGATVQSDSYLVFSTGGSPQERMRITSTGGISFGASGTAYGTSGQVLKSNGDAAPTWVDQSTIASGSAPLTNTYVGYGSASNLLTGSSSLTWNGSTLSVNGSINAATGQTTSFIARVIASTGAPNEGTHAGYLLLAKAYISGNQATSFVNGEFVFKRGGTTSGNRTDIYRVASNSGYQSEGFVVQITNGAGVGDHFFVSTVKVTYSGTVYHAIKTTIGGGGPDNGIVFYGSTSNAGMIYVDATYVSSESSFGNYTFLTSAGNLGFGTTSPTEKFHVFGTATSGSTQGPRINLQYSGTSGAAESLLQFLDFRGVVNASMGSNLQDDGVGTAAAEMVFKTSTAGTLTERLRINRNGAIAFNGASSYGSSGQVLQSNGNAPPTWVALSSRTVGTSTQVNTVLQTASASYYPTFVDSNNAAATAESLYTTSSFSINPQSGNVSIGGRTEGIWLGDIGNNSAYDNVKLYYTGYNGGAPQVIFQPRTTPGSGVVATAFYFKNSNGSSFASNNRADVYVDGNVGIGTVSPSGKLHLYQNAGGSNQLTLDTNFASGNAYAINPFITGISNGGFSIRDVTNSVERLVIQYSTGNVGIGTTTPQYKLDVNNGATSSNSLQASFGTTMSAGYWSGIHFGYSESSNQLYRKSAIIFERQDSSARGKVHILNNGVSGSASATLADAKMTIQYDGGVGIGTTTTLNKFEVAGTSGQLFSVSDSFTGTIFSVNDISGIPSIEVLDTGLVKMAQYNGQLAIGTGTVASSTVTVSIYGMLQTMGTLGEIRASSEITAYFSSDSRLKENIKLIENPITIIDQIRGVTFDWTDEHMARRGGEDGYFVRKHDIGVIAQEVQAVLPELVGTREDGYLAVKYEKLVPLLIEAIKAQQKTIDSLVKDLDTVKEFINNLKNGI